MRNPGGDVHRVQDAKEGRGLVRVGRAQAVAGCQLVREKYE